MTETQNSPIFPKSPLIEVAGILYIARMCDKIRLQVSGKLSADYTPHLGGGLDGFTCEFLRVDYADLAEKVRSGLDDAAVLEWAISVGGERTDVERAWWTSFMRNYGHRDEISEKLATRKDESGFADRDDIVSFFGLIDADECRD